MAVAVLLHHIRSNVQGAIESIDNAYPLETKIYSKFFNGVDPHRIRAVLTRIVAGSTISHYHPVIACANPNLPEMASSWAYCQRSDPTINAMWMRNTPWIYLCPAVFEEQQLPEHENCIGQPHRGALSTGQGLAQTQFSHVFHELVHLYLGVPALAWEMYGIWAVRDLPASESVINPANYVFYLASKFHPSHYITAEL